MADNPKSLASLADELEAMAKKPQYYPRSPAVLMAAAAALRAPTKSFIVDLIERLEKAVSALDGTMPSTVQTLRASIVLLSKLRFSDEQEAALAKTISAVGDALRAPTIARLEKIEERAKEVLREREDSTAAYILEGGTRHVGKPDARKGAAMDRAALIASLPEIRAMVGDRISALSATGVNVSSGEAKAAAEFLRTWVDCDDVFNTPRGQTFRAALRKVASVLDSLAGTEVSTAGKTQEPRSRSPFACKNCGHAQRRHRGGGFCSTPTNGARCKVRCELYQPRTPHNGGKTNMSSREANQA